MVRVSTCQDVGDSDRARGSSRRLELFVLKKRPLYVLWARKPCWKVMWSSFMSGYKIYSAAENTGSRQNTRPLAHTDTVPTTRYRWVLPTILRPMSAIAISRYRFGPYSAQEAACEDA